MSTIEYRFNNEEDLGFYILNAVCHDWIHDFNNYGRMAKILNYILALIPSVVPAADVAAADVAATADIAAAADIVATVPDELAAATLSSSDATDVVAVDYSLGEADNAPPPVADAAASIADNVDAVVADKAIIDDDTLSAVAANDAFDIAIRDAALDDAVNIPIIIPWDTLIESQGHKYFDNEKVSDLDDIINVPEILIPNKNVILSSIHLFRLITQSVGNYRLRSTIKKINILQQLSEFIGKSQLLVISKLQPRGISSTNGGYKKQNGGADSGIDIITTDDITLSIYDIIKEIHDSTIHENDKKKLTDFFNMMNEVYINFTIPEISPLEKFNNSLITEILSMFIVNNCENINIEIEAKLYLEALIPSSPHVVEIKGESDTADVENASLLSTNTTLKNAPLFINTSSSKKSYDSPSSPRSVSDSSNPGLYGGGFTGLLYKDNMQLWGNLETHIDEIKASLLFNVYKGDSLNLDKFNDYYLPYKKFIREIESAIVLIIGPQMYAAKNKIIESAYKLVNRPRRQIKDLQKMVDTINDLIFDNIIKTYEDTKQRSGAVQKDSSQKLTPEARVVVQKISEIVAKKTLELTMLASKPSKSKSASSSSLELNQQISIITTVAHGTGFTGVDENLFDYFLKTYKFNTDNIKTGTVANRFLVDSIHSCSANGKSAIAECRAINNAIPDGTLEKQNENVKLAMESIVVCPTSSVCDGMGFFGSCLNPKGKEEYFDMNFNISHDGGGAAGGANFYQGSTNISKNKLSVNINYGFQYNRLILYNFLDININTQPIILQANYTFKGVINRIIDIWKSNSSPNIDELWTLLETNDYFLSILKLGSQKAIGDIFQEINSTLDNGGYISKTGAQNGVISALGGKKTYGLMGDRPSGIRVFKLLKDARRGKNPNACGGYISTNNSLIFIPSSPLFIASAADVASSKKGLTKKGGKNTFKKNKYIKNTRGKKKYKNKTIKKHKKHRKTKNKK